MSKCLRLGDTAPDFKSETQFGDISFHDWAGNNWVYFFSHPADFTPVCTTEMGRTAQLAKEFEKRGVKPLGLSVDSAKEHKEWIKDVNETQNTVLEFPIIADVDRKVSELYGMIHPGESETASVRTVFIIDPNKKIRLMMTYPMSVGRNFDEILRVIDALQTSDKYGIATGADWKPGAKVIIPPSITTDEARKDFPNLEEIKPYLRFTDV